MASPFFSNYPCRATAYCIRTIEYNDTFHTFHTTSDTTLMADDPRALLRAARKERRVAHPHASYTSTGNLLCNLCEIPIKSEAAWGAHLHSTGHTLRLSREQDAAVARKAEAGNGKKRKAGSPADDEGSDGEDRKRVKASDVNNAAPTQQTPAETAPAPAPAPIPDRAANDDQAEMDALEADLAALERETRANAGVVSNTISAPAQSAEDIAAQAREEQSAQRGRRDIELEEEKEEAARALEEEFAEMQTLENRVKKLREKREMLRAGKTDQAIEDAKVAVVGADGRGALDEIVRSVQPEQKSEINGEEGEDDDDDDDDDEELDDWTFGAR
jgi:zinc finger protein 830